MSNLARSDEPKVNQVQIKSKAQMTKKNEEEWNGGTLEYWVKQNNSWILLHYSIIPLFHYSRIILSNFSHFGIHLTFGF